MEAGVSFNFLKLNYWLKMAMNKFLILTIGCCTGAGWSGLSIVIGGWEDGRLVGWGLGSETATVLLAAAMLTPPAGFLPRYVWNIDKLQKLIKTQSSNYPSLIIRRKGCRTSTYKIQCYLSHIILL